MVFKNLKTSSQISLKFTLFSAGILLVLSLIMNVFFFSSWYFEIDLMRPDFFDRPREGNREFSPWKNFPLRELRFPLGSVEATAIQEEIRFLDISEIDEYYLQVQKMGNWLIVRNVTQEVELQIMLLWISLLVIGGGMLLSYLVSLFFVKSALKKLNNLNEMLDSLDIERLDQQLEITGHRHDEINRVMRKFNQALVKIECQTRGLKDFVKNASHELKTPLMGITSLLSLARKSKDYETTLEQIKIEIKRMDSLLETLLLITQIEEKTELSKEKTELTASIKSLVEQFQLQYQEKNLTLVLDLPEHLEKEVNPQGRTSIITNLINNAFKFVGQAGTIKISLSDSSFQVRNDGEAIPLAQKEKIWERFWQAESSHSERKSFWLGLYLAKLFASKQGFELRCESWTNQGVRFILDF